MTMADRIVVMRDGIVEQVGSPLDLYDRPVNTFVASFIGSPSMNFLSARIGEDRQSVVTENGIHLPVGYEASIACGGAVSYGIRPEHLTIAPGGQGIPIVVTNIEPTGSETFVQGTVDGQKISAQLRERLSIKTGEVLNLTLAPANSHLFDAASGMRL
jgi:multiple sugar transport system ATP-binding protein